MAWFRLHEGTYADPKWPIIARKSNTNVGTVVSIWIALLDHASQNDDRGSLDGFDPETVDALYGYEDGTCQAVILAMEEKGMILDGRLANWEKRQPLKEDATAQERKQRYQERRRNAPERTGTPEERAGTPENAPDKIRIEKNKNINPPLSPPGGMEAEPDLEFCQFRQAYSATVLPEGEQAGLQSWLTAKRRRELPPLNQLLQDIAARKDAGFWNPGYEPGLEKYIRDRTWTAPICSRRREREMSFAERDADAWAKAKAEAEEYDRQFQEAG